MKKLRTRLVSAFLVIMTLLTLLPTSALAASGSGTGIKPTDNTNYWTTRLLHDGTPYSYKPPMAAGKLLYCLDRGYGYRWGTASFLNSYTYTSATGADADTVLKTALAQSGMGELDAQQLENFKWMMTFISDYAYLARLSEERNMSCIGATNYGSRQITVSSAGATVHEFGHFLDELMGSPSQTEGFYQEESGTAAALLRPYALTNEQEYFADCFVYWLTYRDNSKKMAALCSAAPKTYAYLLALESQNWQPAA